MQITSNPSIWSTQKARPARFSGGAATPMRTREQSEQPLQSPSGSNFRKESEAQQQTASIPITKEQVAQLNKISQSQKSLLEQLDKLEKNKAALSTELIQQAQEIENAQLKLEAEFEGKNITASKEQVQQVEKAIDDKFTIHSKIASLQNKQFIKQILAFRSPLTVMGASPPQGDNKVQSVSPLLIPTSPANPTGRPPVEASKSSSIWRPKADRNIWNVSWDMFKHYIQGYSPWLDMGMAVAGGALAAIGTPVMVTTIPIALAGISGYRLSRGAWALRQGAQSEIVDRMYEKWSK